MEKRRTEWRVASLCLWPVRVIWKLFRATVSTTLLALVLALARPPRIEDPPPRNPIVQVQKKR